MQGLGAAMRSLSRAGRQLARGAEAEAAAGECSTSGCAAACGGSGGPAAGPWQWHQARWASKKQGGSTQNTKDSLPKFLGVKLFGGQACEPGHIIVRQRGTEFHPGHGVGMGRDHTLFALVPGRVVFRRDPRTKRRFVSVDPAAAAPMPAPAAAAAAPRQQAAAAVQAAA